MRDTTIPLMVLMVAVLSGMCQTAPTDSQEIEARKFIQEASTKLYNYYNKLGDDVFPILDTDSELELDSLDKLMMTADAVVGIVNESKKFDYSLFQDEELKYIFKIIRRSADEAVIGKKQLLLMFISINMLEELAIDKDIAGYRNSSMKLAYFPDIQNIIAQSKESEELEYYWNAWREKNKEWAALHLEELIQYLKNAANLTDITPIEYWLHDHNITEMEQVMIQIQPLYLQLHAFIRNQLYKKYGEKVVKPNGPIPDHLFQQVLAQAWTNDSVLDEMFPHKDLPPYDMILKKDNYETLKLFKMADEFYQSLGFDPVPDNLWGTQIKKKTGEDEGDCQPTIYDVSPNVSMRYCHKMDFRKFLQAHGYMSRLYYAREKKHLPAYYFPAHNLEYPVGEAVLLSASTPKHLKAIGIVTDFEFTDKVLMNRLLRMGIHTLLNIPLFFVHTKVMSDLFSEKANFSELNKHYWMLMEKYVGVEPPVDRGLDSYDFPFKFYIELNENQQARKFESEVLGYQFYKKLCAISGQYPSESLQNCDFYGSKSVGEALKKMMKLGSSKPKNEVLATLLPGDSTMNAESLLEFYQPIESWLTTKNRDMNLEPGWVHSEKKVGQTLVPEH